ncbi:hypothetical protein, partial [Sporisorium scitamineum]
LRGTAASGLQKASASSSPSNAVLLILQFLQSLLTESSKAGSRPSASYQKLAESGVLPTAVNDAVQQMRTLCVQAPIDTVKPTARSAKAEFYTTTALLVEMLSDTQRSGIDEPNLLRYLESVQTQLVKEAQAAGPRIETAQMRAVTLRKKVDAALALEDGKEQTKKITKLKDQLKEATSPAHFASSEELWSLRILIASHLARTSGKSVQESRDAVAAEWHRGLQACSEHVDSESATYSAETSLLSNFLDWLDNGVFGTDGASRKQIKASYSYASEQYRWAVRETASLLSRSHSASVSDLEAVQAYRQSVHDLCMLRYVQLGRRLAKHDEIVSWLLQSCFASHQAWLDVISELQICNDGDKDTARSQKDTELVDKIFTKLLQVKSTDVAVWISYLGYLAASDMTKALKALERCRSTLEESEYKLVEREWQGIYKNLQN